MTREKIAQILDMSRSGVFKWANEKRPIIVLLDKYFMDDDIDEFLALGKIERFEKILNQNNSFLINVCYAFGMFLTYNEVSLIFAKFCKKYKNNPGKFDFSEESFLFFLANELGAYEEYHIRIFKNTKLTFSEFPSFLTRVKQLLKDDFSLLISFIENNEIAPISDVRRPFCPTEFKFFLKQYLEASVV